MSRFSTQTGDLKRLYAAVRLVVSDSCSPISGATSDSGITHTRSKVLTAVALTSLLSVAFAPSVHAQSGLSFSSGSSSTTSKSGGIGGTGTGNT